MFNRSGKNHISDTWHLPGADVLFEAKRQKSTHWSVSMSDLMIR